MAEIGKKEKRNAKIVAGGGENLPVLAEIVAPKCKVCNSPYRREIDACLTMGWSQTNVRRHFNQLIPDAAEQFRAQNISIHARKHLRSSDAAIRKIWEERAAQMGLDIVAAETFILTEEGVFDALIYEGMRQVRGGTTTVEARDVLQAVQQRDKRREQQNEIAVDAVLGEFKEFMAAVKEAATELLGEAKGEALNSLIFDKFAKRIEHTQSRMLAHGINPPAELISGADEIDDADFEEVEEDGSSGSDG